MSQRISINPHHISAFECNSNNKTLQILLKSGRTLSDENITYNECLKIQKNYEYFCGEKVIVLELNNK